MRLMVSCSLPTTIICLMTVVERRHEKLIYIYLLLFNNSITDIEYAPNYTAFGLPLTHQVR